MSPTLKKGTTCLTFWAGVGAVAMGDRMAHVGSWVQGASNRARWFRRKSSCGLGRKQEAGLSRQLCRTCGALFFLALSAALTGRVNL